MTSDISGIESEDRETDVGLAVEIGGGALVALGSLAVGVQIAVPMGFHFEDDDNDAATIDHDDTSFDLDLLATVATSF